MKHLLPALLLLAAPALAQSEAPAAAGGRYQIVKATESAVWRLDTQTGEVVACRFEGTEMVCGSTATAITREKTSFKDYKAEKEAERRAQREDDLAFFEKAIDIFKKLVAFFMEQERAAQPRAAISGCDK